MAVAFKVVARGSLDFVFHRNIQILPNSNYIFGHRTHIDGLEKKYLGVPIFCQSSLGGGVHILSILAGKHSDFICES